MVSKKILGGGALLLGVLIAATEIFRLPSILYYVWALLAFVWGILVLLEK